MKTLGRILIILLAVAIVSGATILIVNATGAGSSPTLPGRDGGFARPGFIPAEGPDGFEGGEREGGRFGLNRSLMLLVPLTIIVAVVLGFERLLEFLRVRRLARAKAQSR